MIKNRDEFEVLKNIGHNFLLTKKMIGYNPIIFL
ncbi:hypothetical protein SAMN05446037_100342 [Anaerovirgula multivorans]|uniref:Uncharacterized protein n=1 Tax=Anaerovirgula multivorans TaxID=312168 RepID=A0A239B6W0_9FIRM|nr:hypothetical protein SAMN05446037_100342 [Anaerovirgula multivorans]